MNAWQSRAAGSALVFGFLGCASIIDFEEPFEQTGGNTSTGSTAPGGSGASTITTTSTTSGASCTPKSSCAEVGFTCGTFFNGCEDEDCGTCTAPRVCGAASHTCACPNTVTAHPTLIADTTIQNHPSWQCGALTAGSFPCINLSQYLDDARALLRFTVDAATAKALQTPGAVSAVRLTLRPAAVCDGSTFAPQGNLHVFALRNDWDEGQARWCHRSGPQDSPTVNPWSMPGANDPALDHGPLAADFPLPGDNMPFDVDIDPTKLVSPLVTGTELSLLLVTPPSSKLVIKTQEGGAPATLDIDYCPVP